MSAFSRASVKLTIASVDDPGIRVEAQYNPKELQVDQTVPWQKPQAANQTGSQQGSGGGGGGGGGNDDPIALEFTGAQGRTMSVELLFDGYEDGAAGGAKVVAAVGALETLARVRDPKSTDEKMRRPHQCLVSWGARGLPSFQCVIESLSTKYTMFSSEGQPLRATSTVKLKEANAVDKKSGGK